MKISTKTGDDGSTALMFGRRVSKNCARVRAYGAVDEFSATLGLARAFAKGKPEAEELLHIQEKLVFLMTELATAKEDFSLLEQKKIRVLGPDDLSEIEEKIDKMEKSGVSFSGWTHPGESPEQAALDMARAKCRAAEREIVELENSEGLARALPLKYINRLADYLWLLAQK